VGWLIGSGAAATDHPLAAEWLRVSEAYVDYKLAGNTAPGDSGGPIFSLPPGRATEDSDALPSAAPLRTVLGLYDERTAQVEVARAAATAAAQRHEGAVLAHQAAGAWQLIRKTP
jgi:hypothetical protein